MDRATHDDYGRTVEWGHHLYRASLYSFEVTMVDHRPCRWRLFSRDRECLDEPGQGMSESCEARASRKGG